VFGGGGVGEGRGVLSAAALTLAGAAQLRGYYETTISIFIIHLHLLILVLILIIWEAHLDNILALPPIT
jgi:hypothetical protein